MARARNWFIVFGGFPRKRRRDRFRMWGYPLKVQGIFPLSMQFPGERYHERYAIEHRRHRRSRRR